MPKLIIPKESVPDINVYIEKTQVRFRIITDDKNYSSYWSPIFSVDPELTFIRGTREIEGLLNLEKHTGYVSAVWDSVAAYKEIDSVNTLIYELKDYDIWIKFAGNGGANPGEWIYKERISSTSLNIAIPSQYQYGSGSYASPKYMYVEIYRKGSPALRYNSISNAITQNSSSINIATDTITTPSAHQLSAGESVVYEASSSIGGLSNDSIYWVRPVSSTSFNIFSSQNNALDNVNKIDLTSTGSGTGTFSHYPFLVYKGLVTTL